MRAHCGNRVETVIEAAEDGRINLETALRYAGENEALLLLTSDLPFITQAYLNDFLNRVDGAEVAMPLARADSYVTAYPNATDHATTLGRERMVNGCVFYFSAGTAPRVIAIARHLFAARKSRPHMVMLLDLPLLLAWIFTAYVSNISKHMLNAPWSCAHAPCAMLPPHYAMISTRWMITATRDDSLVNPTRFESAP